MAVCESVTFHFSWWWHMIHHALYSLLELSDGSLSMGWIVKSPVSTFMGTPVPATIPHQTCWHNSLPWIVTYLVCDTENKIKRLKDDVMFNNRSETRLKTEYSSVPVQRATRIPHLIFFTRVEVSGDFFPYSESTSMTVHDIVDALMVYRLIR